MNYKLDLLGNSPIKINNVHKQNQRAGGKLLINTSINNESQVSFDSCVLLKLYFLFYDSKMYVHEKRLFLGFFPFAMFCDCL